MDQETAGTAVASPITVSDLRDQPCFFDATADRIWNAWWRPYGHLLPDVRAGLLAFMEPAPVPCAFVAHRNHHYLGSVLLIASDVPERPAIGPWIAALWVEEEARGQGIASSLIEMALGTARRAGIPRAYLCATEANAPYYMPRDWTPIETNVGDDHLTIFVRET